MKLTNLKSLPIKSNLKPLTNQNKPNRSNKYLTEIEMILYSSNLCYFAHKLYYDEIKVKNKSPTQLALVLQKYKIPKNTTEQSIENLK